MTRELRAAATIAGNELRRNAQDTMSSLLFLALPLVIVLVLGLVIGDAFTGGFVPARPIPIAIEGAPGSVREAFEIAAASEAAAPYVTPVAPTDARRGGAAVIARDIRATIVVPDDFPWGTIHVIAAPDGLSGDVTATLARAAWADVASAVLAESAWSDVGLDRVEVPLGAAASAPAVGRDVRPWLGTSAFEYYAIAMTVYFAMFAAVGSMTSYGRDRTTGVYFRTRVAGVGRWTYVVGRLLGSFVLAVALIALLSGATRLLFGVTWGQVVPWSIVTLVGGMALAALALLLAALTPGAKGLETTGTFVVPALALVGGSFTPLPVLIEFMPAWLASISSSLPNRALLDGYFVLMQDGVLADVLPYVVSMLVGTAGALVVALLVMALRGRSVA